MRPGGRRGGVKVESAAAGAGLLGWARNSRRLARLASASAIRLASPAAWAFASCCSAFCIGNDEMAVDTHVWRLCKALGWVPEKATRDQT